MSMETSQWLNTNTLIGMTEERGTAWHYRAEDQGEKSNHYPGFVPVQDVIDRLFYWEAQNAKMRFHMPATVDNFTFINDEGQLFVDVCVPDRNVTYHPETGQVFGVLKTDSIHQYSKWLLENLAHLVTPDGLAATTDVLGIGSAGVLRGGAQAWVQLEPSETFKTAEGLSYRPHILAYSSHDSTLATTYGCSTTIVVCDNTMQMARNEMSRSKRQHKVRRSVKSMGEKKIRDARLAMDLIIEDSEGFAEDLKELCATTVTNRQFEAFLGEWAPFPSESGPGRTRAENKREKLMNLWRNDNRVSPWAGTAFGVLQATNTYDHHESQKPKDMQRSERNMSRAINGDQATSDARTLKLLDLVLSA